MTRITLSTTALVLGAAVLLSPVQAVAKPNILPGDAAKHLPQLSPETIEKRKLRKEKRAKAREQRRLQRLQSKSKN